jgi:hypothetical protein
LVIFVSAPFKPSFPGREFGVAGTPRERPEKLGTCVCMYVQIVHEEKKTKNITGFINDPD